MPTKIIKIKISKASTAQDRSFKRSLLERIDKEEKRRKGEEEDASREEIHLFYPPVIKKIYFYSSFHFIHLYFDKNVKNVLCAYLFFFRSFLNIWLRKQRR